ncbi:hypothetical protein UlMin_012364 [Ulmus minor]
MGERICSFYLYRWIDTPLVSYWKLAGNVGIPRQLVVTKDPLSIPYEVTNARLCLPLVVKPLLVDESSKSHELFLAYNQFSLSKLEPPLVVRQFPLPDVSKCELEDVAGVFHFPRVSYAAATTDESNLDPSIAELPLQPFLQKLAKELRCWMHVTSDVFYVIDINYFPGKLWEHVEYEHIFTYFLLSLMQNKYKKRVDA